MSLLDLNIQTGSFGYFLKAYEHVMVLLTLIGVLVLVYYLVLKPAGMTASSLAGMQNYSAGALGFYGLRDDGGATLGDKHALTSQQSYGDAGCNSDSSVAGFSNGGYEPPMYWPAGSLGLLNAYDRSALGLDDQKPSGVKAGMKGSYAMGSVQGMNNGKKSGMQNKLDAAIIGF